MPKRTMFLLVRETCYMSAKTKEHYFVFKLPKLGCLHSIATEVEHGHVINLYSCSVILTAIVIIFVTLLVMYCIKIFSGALLRRGRQL